VYKNIQLSLPLFVMHVKYGLNCSVDADLVANTDDLPEYATGLELDDVGLNRNLDEILQNEAWANDAA
jgi:hypothetical protein